jgi:DNA-directed RNA polymerase specialized sigma subunit
MAALEAVAHYDPGRQVSVAAFLRMRVLGRAITRYRQEWRYGVRHVACGEQVRHVQCHQGPSTPPSVDSLGGILGTLTPNDQWLITRLFWEGETEADVARKLGLTQQAVSKRKKTLMKVLHSKIAGDLVH